MVCPGVRQTLRSVSNNVNKRASILRFYRPALSIFDNVPARTTRWRKPPVKRRPEDGFDRAQRVVKRRCTSGSKTLSARNGQRMWGKGEKGRESFGEGTRDV